MIGSLRALLIIAVVAVALGIVLAVDLVRESAPVDHALVPGFDASRVTELEWTRPPPLGHEAGGEAIDLIATPAWHFRSPTVPADPDTVAAVLAALRGARWHRVGEPTPFHRTLTIVSGATRRTLGIGEPLAGTEQVWLVDGDRGLLVDGWVARALDPDRLSLSIKMPFADVARAKLIRLGADLRIGDTPRRLLEPNVRLAPELASELEHALAEITLVVAAPTHGHGITIDVDATHMEIGGPCPSSPELVAIAGTAGQGCVEKPAALEQVIAKLHQPPAQIVDRRPFAGDTKRIQLPDGTLELSPPRIAGAAADPARVAELLAALAAPDEPVALPAGTPIAKIEISNTILDLYPSHVLVRRGEAVALKPAPGAWQVLVRPARELRDLALWVEDPSTITAIAIDGKTYRAGTVLGEWTGASDPKAVQALADALAAPRALAFAEGTFVPVHRVVLTIAQPGKTVTHELAVADGCRAQLGNDVLVLPTAVCTAIARAR